jgi:hypothetical protein
MLGPPAAGLVIYLAVIFAWLYAAGVGFGWWNKPYQWWLWVLVGGYAAVLLAAWWFFRGHLDEWAAGPAPNEDLVRRGYEAHAKDELRSFQSKFADKITFHPAQQSGAAFKFKIHDVLANDKYVVALLLGTAQCEGKRIEQNVAHVFNVSADGKVTDWWNCWGDQTEDKRLRTLRGMSSRVRKFMRATQ